MYMEINVKDTKCLSSIVCTYDVFAAGALACLEEGQERAINKAVNEEEWNTAQTLLKAVIDGMLSCSVW